MQRDKAEQRKNRRVILHTPEPGAGAGQYVAQLAGALAAEGERVALLCPANFLYEKEVRSHGVEVVRAPKRGVEPARLARRLLRNIGFAAGSLKTLWKTVQHDDVIHFQFAQHLGLGLLSFLLARLKGAKVVLTVHDPLPHRWILPANLRWIEKGFLSIGYSLCHKFIVHNRVGGEILAEEFGVGLDDVAVIPHGPLHAATATPREAMERVEQGDEPMRLLIFGSVRENKGLDLAIAAIQQLRRAEQPVCLTIAGPPPTSMEKSYWESCKRLIESQPNAIESIERFIEDAEVVPLFERHDAVLLPYVKFFSESGVATLALSRERPILATAAGGLGELLRACDCGLLIEEPTVAGVVGCIEKALAAPMGVLKQKGLNGSAHVMNGRSWAIIAQRTRRLYDGLRSSGARVILHTPEPASSAALYVEALSKALAAEGVRISVVCPANHQAIEALKADSAIEIHTCCARGTRTEVALAVKLWENLRFVASSVWTLLRAAKPGDIVHLQYILHLPFGLIFLASARLRGAHVVFTVHDPVPHKFLLPAYLRWLEVKALRWAYQWSDVLIVHSEAGQRKLEEVFRIPAKKIRVIVHGPYELTKPVGPCAEINRLEVLFFGSLRENKAPHLAIQAVRQLADEGLAIRLTIAGGVVNRKEEAYWARCRQLIDPAGEAVRLLEGFIPDAELPELFSNCHCLVLPYTNFSSDSGVAYMALANGKAIISTGAGGLGWLLEQSRGGIAISDAGVAGVSSALRLAVELGPATLERMGRTGAEWVLSHCGWPKVAQETRNLYARWMDDLRAAAAAGEEDVAQPTPVEAAP